MMKFIKSTGWLAVGGLLISHAVHADEPALRHGAIYGEGLNLDSGLTWVTGLSDDDRVGGSNALSVDFLMSRPINSGTLIIYVEGNSSPPSPAALGDSNADAGTALDFNDGGRLQVSELLYAKQAEWGIYSYGLIDAGSYLDTSTVANDETSQFLAPALVNNTSIGMPDYSLGAAFHYHADGWRPGYTLYISGSHGLGDNPNRSYTELMDLDAPGKGLFTAAEGYVWKRDLKIRLGLWGRSDAGAASGSYFSLDSNNGPIGRFNLRWGLASGSGVDSFYSLAWDRELGSNNLGLGHAVQNDGSVTATTTEAYLRMDLAENLQLTPSIQWLHNAAFDNSGSSHAPELTLLNLRLNYLY